METLLVGLEILLVIVVYMVGLLGLAALIYWLSNKYGRFL